MTDRPSIPTGPPPWLSHLIERIDSMIDAFHALNENVSFLVGQTQSVGTTMGQLDERLRKVEEEQAKQRVRLGVLEAKGKK